MSGRDRTEVSREIWSPPPLGVFKFNVDGATRGKPSPTGTGGMLRNSGRVTSLFFPMVGVRVSNEEKLLGIRRALVLWAGFGQGKLIVEGGLSECN